MNTKSQLLVSIIIPVYNVRPYLSEALDSVIHQTYRHLEIIVIDDGSTDGSSDICDDYEKKDNRIIVIHQDNRGLSAARNTGLNIMTGDIVAFFDPDDVLALTFIEDSLKLMLLRDADIIVCRYLIQWINPSTPNRKKPKKIGPSIDSGDYDRISSLRALAEETINVSVWNKLYRKELWEKIRFPQGHVYEDIATTFKIFSKCDKVCVLDKPLYKHKRRPGSISNTVTQKSTLDRILANRHFEKYIEANIPDIFTWNHLKKWRQSRINYMIVSYIRFSGKGKNNNSFYEDLRKSIISEKKKIRPGMLSLRTRAAWHILYWCPRLLQMAYLIYYPIRHSIFAITRH